ncbi:transcriptional regulator family: Helix-loop-helix [Trichoderma aggressivum f. europaeum]|uniref:Transcriptional regulator family: Helix-loop-helix n=1 Tax=Trichoderma aggressivum f. europaeum TaxID=173218 RepID=A0AAE1III8_9HYPO|nr:transcriptional regulator family: Helix-loop-helix [Trichoderma aggressivum f. europaeum]
MADEDGTNGLGFDDPSFGFIGGGPVSLDGISDAPNFGGDPSAAFLDAGVWPLDASPQANSYDISSNTTLSSAQPGYVSPSWPAPTFDPRQQQQQQQQPDSVAFGLPNIDPASVYLPGVAATKRGALPVSKPSLRSLTALSPALQEQLRNIAMPPHLQYGSPKSASSPESARTGAASSPDVSGGSQRDSRKRKIPADDLDDDDLLEEGGKPIKKTAHNMIEKRYRTNINDKIAALRDSVPSLRIMSKSARGEDTTEDREELHGLTPAHKLNKATVLSKATEYIRHLEKRNNRLLDENSAMHQRIAAFEKLFMAGAMNGSMPPMQQPTPIQYPQDGQSQQQSQQQQQQQQQSQMTQSPLDAQGQESSGMPTGLIDVPEDMKRILSQMPGQPYPVPQQLFRSNPTVVGQQQIRPMQQQQQEQQQGQQPGWSASPYFGKLMVGSLAGLMILEAVREEETSNEEPQGRGLFALPVQLLRHMPSHLNVGLAGYQADISIKFMLLFGLVLWVFIPSLFSAMDRKPKKQQSTDLHPAPSLASPISVRRRAWETAIQTVWVPHHNFFLEAAALMLKTLKLSVRNVFGIHAYHLLTGLTPEQEVARVRAWATALDAQLTGGDAEICMSRLILTLLASGTVPNTPSGLMLKALHVRVLLWDLSQKWYQLGLVNFFATKVAQRQWNAARDLNNRLINGLQENEISEMQQAGYILPDHLAALVEQECDAVLTATVIQRAHNLAFNEETTYNSVPIDGMDSVVDDTAIGSPMDALAAWWSTAKVHDLLTTTLYGAEEVPEDEVMDLAVKVAPLGSNARARAILARSVLAYKSRGDNIAAAVQVLRVDTGSNGLMDPMALTCSEPNPFDGLAPTPLQSDVPDPDLQLCLRCAVATAHLKRLGGESASKKQYVRTSIEKVVDLTTKTRMTLLSFTSVMEVLEQILAHKDTTNNFAPLVERLAAILRLWMGSELALDCGVPPDLQERIINKCLGVTKRIVGMEVDTGYDSMTDDEGF